jgi:hypothetical protein
MSEYFTFNTEQKPFIPAPIFPDFDPKSEMSAKIFNAKETNDMNFWSEMRQVLDHDFKTLPKDRFKSWASVMSVPFMTRTKGINYIAATLSAVTTDEVYAKALVENFVGLDKQDFDAFYSMFDDFPTTMNRIQQIAHLVICGYTKEKLAEMDTIVELGAGIGDLADVIYKLGFKGKYIIYDFPEVGQIQKWYHDQLGHKNIVHTDNLEDLENADLCIATWSLTEMPLELREEIMKKIGDSKNWLIAYSDNIFGLDNLKYITEDFLPRFTNHDITTIPIPHMTYDGDTKYVTVKSR